MVSHSRADGYLLCRRKDYYGYTLGLQRVSESDSLSMGSAVHECLEALYRHVLEAGGTRRKQKAALKDGFKAMHQKYLELVKNGFEDSDRFTPLKEILRWYVELEPFVKNGWLIMAVEQEYILRYDDDDSFRFVIDLVAEDPQGKTVIVDHKTTFDFYQPDAAALQGQVPKYIGAMRALGHKVHYGLYNELRTRKIRGEKKNKGELVADLEKLGEEAHEYEERFDVEGNQVESVVKDIPLSKLTVADLTARAKAHGVDLYAGPTAEQMHDLLYIKPSASRVVRTFEEQAGVSREINARELLPVEVIEKSAYRTANKMVCQSCSFRDLCEAELAGQSVKLLMETEYKKREKRPMPEGEGNET